MKKEYRKPLAKFHELKCNSVMAGSGTSPDYTRMFRFTNLSSEPEPDTEDVEEWSD